MMNVKRYPRKSLANEKGMVLVVALLLIAALVLLGTTAVMMSTTDMKISTNYKTGTQVFYIAEAGLEVARNQLRINITAGTTINQLLAARAGGGVLSDSTRVNFFSDVNNGTFLSDDVPYIAQTSLGGGTYRVYLTNDGTDGVTSQIDTNNKVTLTSIGQGPGNSLAILQEVVLRPTVPPVPGAIILPGPNVDYAGGNSNASGVAGGTISAISTTTPAAETSVEAHLGGGTYTCQDDTGSFCINSEPDLFDPAWKTVTGIETLASTFRSAADTDLPGPGPYTLTSAQLGDSPSASKIVYVEGDATIGPLTGYGVLIVTGTLTISGAFNYNGLIMCIGKGHIERSGGGSGAINGAVFTAKTRDDSGNLLSELGIPYFHNNGLGNADIKYDPDQLNSAGGTKFVKRAWQQI